MPSDKIKIWERQKGETSKAYSAFKVYLEMEDRGIQKVAERLSVSPQNIRKWSGKNNWEERAAAYDSSIVEAMRKSKIAAIKDTIRHKLDLADKLEKKALLALEQINLNRISGRTIVEMLTLANQLRNEAREIELLLEGLDNDAPVIVIERRGGVK